MIEITARMKDELIQWMAIHEAAMKNRNLILGDLEEGTIALTCLDAPTDYSIHVTNVFAIASVLGLEESIVKNARWKNETYPYMYTLNVGEVKYYSIHQTEIHTVEEGEEL